MIEQLRTNLEVNTLSLAGISYGGLIATEYANSHSIRVEQLFLIDAAVKFLTLSHLDTICQKYKAESIEDFFAPQDAKGLKKQLSAAYYRTPFIPDFILKSLYKEMCAPYRKNWLGLIQSLRKSNQELSKRNYKFDFKTTIFWGAEDEIIPLQVGKNIAYDLGETELNVITKAGHMPNLERSKKFNAILQKAIKSNYTIKSASV